MKFYKGDIIQRKEDDKGMKTEWKWGQELIGVNSVLTSNGFILFHRPFKNWVRHFLNTICP